MNQPTAATFNESVTTFDEGLVNESTSPTSVVEAGIQITGLDVVTSESDDSQDWSVESYANDSMELTRLRLAHARVQPIQFEDASSLGYGSTDLPAMEDDDDDWTVESYSNDSMILNARRLSLSAEQKAKNQQQAAPVAQPQPQAPVQQAPVQQAPVQQQQQQQAPKQQPVQLARITRRRASMSECVQQNSPTTSPVQPPQPTRSAPRRRMSMSSMSTIRSEDESLSTQESGGNQSSSTSSSKDSKKKKKKTISRHKSMPYVKSAPLGNMVPLWPAGGEEGRTKMARRVSNGGCPSAA